MKHFIHIGGTGFNLVHLRHWTKERFKAKFTGKLTVDLDLVWNEIEKASAELLKTEIRNGGTDKVSKKRPKTRSK